MVLCEDWRKHPTKKGIIFQFFFLDWQGIGQFDVFLFFLWGARILCWKREIFASDIKTGGKAKEPYFFFSLRDFLILGSNLWLFFPKISRQKLKEHIHSNCDLMIFWESSAIRPEIKLDSRPRTRGSPMHVQRQVIIL